MHRVDPARLYGVEVLVAGVLSEDGLGSHAVDVELLASAFLVEFSRFSAVPVQLFSCPWL